MNILHITSQYPNKNFITAGIFIQKLIHNLSNYSKFKFLIFIPTKIYYKRKRFKAFNLYKNDFYSEKIIPFFKRFYVPFFGITRLSYVNAYLAWIFCKRYLIRLIKENRVTLIHAHFANPDGYLAYRVSKHLGIPYIMHLHGRDIQEYHTFPEREKKVTKLIYANANCIICNSTKTQRLLKSVMNINDRSQVIAFGVDNIMKRTDYKINTPVKMISVGNLIEIKGIQYTIDALNELKEKINFNYSIIGDGIYQKYLEEKVLNYGLSKQVKFLGRMENSEMIKLMQKYDIFILPSYEEAFGIVYLEALSCGCSVIGVKGEGCEDINNHGKCIYLVEPKSSVSIKATIIDILNNPEKRIDYINTGYKVLSDNYSWEIISKTIENLYDSIVNAG